MIKTHFINGNNQLQIILGENFNLKKKINFTDGNKINDKDNWDVLDCNSDETFMYLAKKKYFFCLHLAMMLNV